MPPEGPPKRSLDSPDRPPKWPARLAPDAPPKRRVGGPHPPAGAGGSEPEAPRRSEGAPRRMGPPARAEGPSSSDPGPGGSRRPACSAACAPGTPGPLRAARVLPPQSLSGPPVPAPKRAHRRGRRVADFGAPARLVSQPRCRPRSCCVLQGFRAFGSGSWVRRSGRALAPLGVRFAVFPKAPWLFPARPPLVNFISPSTFDGLPPGLLTPAPSKGSAAAGSSLEVCSPSAFGGGASTPAPPVRDACSPVARLADAPFQLRGPRVCLTRFVPPSPFAHPRAPKGTRPRVDLDGLLRIHPSRRFPDGDARGVCCPPGSLPDREGAAVASDSIPS